MQPFRTQTTLLIALGALFGAQAVRAEKPVFHSHHQGANGEESDHYKDSAEKPPKAKVGQTLFTSRALMGKNGVTDLEVTTGALDSTSVPPGYLTEVHVRALRADGKEQFEHEFEHLRSGGGYAKFSFPLPVPAKPRDDRDEKKDTHLEHGQSLQVKVHGKGILSSREGEVEAKLDNVVKYRPDLALMSLQNPATARPKMPVDITASVFELMHDTGAHADCVLSVDGAVADTVPGIWVDASGNVSCHFQVSFAVSGTHSLSVALQNIAPADYDGDNNALSGSIKIENPAVMSYNSTVADSLDTSSSLRDIYSAADGTLLKHDASSTVQHSQSRLFTGSIPASVNLPLKRATFADQSDGTQLASVSLTDVAADGSAPMTDPKWDTKTTIDRFDSASYGFFNLTRYSNAAGEGLTQISWYFPGGDVTYHSENYCKQVGSFTCSGGDYTLSSTSSQPVDGAGAPVTLGKSYGADVVLDDGSSYQGHPQMPLTTSGPTSSGAPLSCRNMTLSGTAVRVCQQGSSSNTSISGIIGFTAPSM